MRLTRTGEEDERAAAAAAETVRQALACEDCGQQQAGGLCEACGYRRRTEALVVEAGMVEATWSAASPTRTTSTPSPPMSGPRWRLISSVPGGRSCTRRRPASWTSTRSARPAAVLPCRGWRIT